MKRSFCWLGFIACWTMVGTSHAQESANCFKIESETVRCVYEIEVVVPPGTPPSETKYPVVYCMDWFILSDYLKSLPGLMELGRLTEPYILVGITQGRNSDDWAVMRTRDFTPAYPSDEFSKSHMYSKALKLTGGAANFTAFLKNELIPLVESKYPGDPSRRCFVGYSLGSLLGTHILIHDPQLFQYYLLGSPSLWFNDYSLVSELEKLSADSIQVIKKVYLSTGEEESWDMLKGFGMLRSAFQEKGFVGSRMKAEIIKESGHVGAMPIALYNGFRFLFPDH